MMSSVPSADRKSKLLVYSVEECPACSQKTKRAFVVGDYVTKDGSKCTKCGNVTKVSLVYAESSKPSG